MTIEEIESSFDSEWVLVGDPVTDEAFNVRKGKVLHHSKDRDEVYRKGVELRPRRAAILCFRRPQPGTAIAVWTEGRPWRFRAQSNSTRPPE